MTALAFLSGYPWLPHSLERRGRPSNAELRRWCRAGSVLVNGSRIGELQAIPNLDTLGIWQLVFFPENPRRCCTMVQDTVELIPLAPTAPPPPPPPGARYAADAA